jgi:hypothetical protein
VQSRDDSRLAVPLESTAHKVQFHLPESTAGQRQQWQPAWRPELTVLASQSLNMPGEVTQYDDGGWCERELVEGKLHGRWTVYYPSGSKKWQRQYQFGRQEGPELHWDERGNLREEKHYHCGVLHGPWRTWTCEGAQETVGEFLLGWEKERIEAGPPQPNGSFARIFPYLTWEPEQFRARFQEVERALALPTWRLVRDEVRPFRDEFGASYWGHVNLLGADEEWPSVDGAPLVPLVQLDCRGLAPLPHFLQGVAFLTMFSRPDPWERNDLVIRTYQTNDALRPIEPPVASIFAKPEFLAVGPAETCFPDRNDLPPGLRVFLEDEFPESLVWKEWGHRYSSRIGGWPAWLQESRVYSYGELALQLDCLDVPALHGGDSAVHYFFRDEAGWTWASESLSPLLYPSGPR